MKNSRGFSLAELLLAFFILAIVGLLIMGLFTAGLDHYRRLDVATTVGTLTTQKMEEVMALEVSVVANEAGNFSPPFADYAYRVEVTPQSGGVKHVEVSVSGPKDVTRRLKSLRAPQDIPLGMQIYLKYDCWACHENTAVPGPYQAIGGPGPSLTTPGIAWTAQNRLDTVPGLQAAVQAETGGTEPEDYIRFSIRKPDAYKDPLLVGGTEMPEFTPDVLPNGEMEALVDWLKTLDTPGP